DILVGTRDGIKTVRTTLNPALGVQTGDDLVAAGTTGPGSSTDAWYTIDMGQWSLDPTSSVLVTTGGIDAADPGCAYPPAIRTRSSPWPRPPNSRPPTSATPPSSTRCPHRGRTSNTSSWNRPVPMWPGEKARCGCACSNAASAKPDRVAPGPAPRPSPPTTGRERGHPCSGEW